MRLQVGEYVSHGDDDPGNLLFAGVVNLVELAFVEDHCSVELKYLLAVEANGVVIRLRDVDVFADRTGGVQLVTTVGAGLRGEAGCA